MVNVYDLHYQDPGSDIDLNWNKITVAVTWRDNYWLDVGHSTNAMANKARGT